VTKAIGGGGMKLVYLAEDLRLAARPCALAEMVDSFTSPDAQKQAIAGFQREADMLAQLSNEHIPRVFDRFSEANHHYLVMEYIDGVTLEDELKRSGGQLKPARVIEIAVQVLDTLEYLHNLSPPVIYRDLKPSNLMLTADGQAKLIDFGIARHFQPLTNATMIGTQGYAPPEQYRGRVETRSDLYALGATMHHALSGRDPAAEAPFSFPPLRKLCPGLEPGLAAIVDEALAYDVVNRPRDATEFKRRLLEVQSAGQNATGTSIRGTLRSAPAPSQGNGDDAKPQLKLPLAQPNQAASSLPVPAAANSPTVLSAAIEIRCPSCARAIPVDSRFCSYCAADLRLPGSPPAFAVNPTDETVILSAPHELAEPRSAAGPYASPGADSGTYRIKRTADGRSGRRNGFRRHFLMLLLIFAAAFIAMRLIHSTAENTVPAGSDTGSIEGSGIAPPAASGAAPEPGERPPELDKPPSLSERLTALRRALKLRGYGSVRVRIEGETVVLSGTVRSDFDRAAVQMLCSDIAGFYSLNDRLRVIDDGAGD
jgi:serine/threonine protein kinase